MPPSSYLHFAQLSVAGVVYSHTCMDPGTHILIPIITVNIATWSRPTHPWTDQKTPCQDILFSSPHSQSTGLFVHVMIFVQNMFTAKLFSPLFGCQTLCEPQPHPFQSFVCFNESRQQSSWTRYNSAGTTVLNKEKQSFKSPVKTRPAERNIFNTLFSVLYIRNKTLKSLVFLSHNAKVRQSLTAPTIRHLQIFLAF